MTKYSLVFKRQVATSYLSGSRSVRAVAIEFGIDHSTVRKWAKAYELHEESGLKKPFERYSAIFKLAVVNEVLNGQRSIRQACAIHNIAAYSTVLTWVRLYNGGGIDALQNKPRGRPKMSKQSQPNPAPEKPLEAMTREELLEELQDRQAEVACLKKLKALVQSGQLAIKPKH